MKKCDEQSWSDTPATSNPSLITILVMIIMINMIMIKIQDNHDQDDHDDSNDDYDHPARPITDYHPDDVEYLKVGVIVCLSYF